jgi:carbonic anhydrase/acetyltransferase-like protein (isoleucine patch superfamily)
MLYSLNDRHLEFRGDRNFIAPSASVIGSVVIESNVSIWFGVVIRGDCEIITLGEQSNIQDGAVLHADPGVPLTLGCGVTVGHSAMLHGCSVGDNSMIGINAVVLNGAEIGKNCIVGANALIPQGKKIPDGSMVMGSPGKVVRQLRDDEIENLKRMAAAYVKNGKNFLNNLVNDPRNNLDETQCP